MNGGVSLRSRKFLEAPTKFGIMYEFAVDNKLFLNEDIQLCLILRDRLEQSGMKYAPIDLARTFAVEGFGPITHANLNLATVFGHHTPFLKLIGDKFIESKWNLSQIGAGYRQVEKLNLLRSYGYTIKFPDE